MWKFFSKHWFTLGLIAAFILPVADFTGAVSAVGSIVNNNNGPDCIMILIFLCSGLMLETKEIKSGIKDLSPVFFALLIIFVLSPFIVYFFLMFPLSHSVAAGLAIVAVMPTTLSSGVVMTASAGGNKAHALITTVSSSFLAVFTVPLSLKFLLGDINDISDVFDPSGLMFELGLKVIVPLIAGYLILSLYKKIIKIKNFLQIISQIFILIMVWMSASSAGDIFGGDPAAVFSLFFFSAMFHVLLSLLCFITAAAAGLGKGRKESVVFMGGQKTLPLSVIVQMTVFPDNGTVLGVCVVHHLVQLVYDSFVLNKMIEKKSNLGKKIIYNKKY